MQQFKFVNFENKFLKTKKGHGKTKDIETKLKQADIIVACCGIPEYVKASWYFFQI
jgi:5,10-methylene-tetrahydrofolate dehydrogenase/methenyl tetrahydrofolate cyclohydrolase